MFCESKKIFFIMIVFVVCFAQYDGGDTRPDPRIRYEYSRDEHNLPEQGDDTSVSDESYDDDFNSGMLQPRFKKNFIDENVDSAISRVKLDQDANSEYEELLDEKDLSEERNYERSGDNEDKDYDYEYLHENT